MAMDDLGVRAAIALAAITILANRDSVGRPLHNAPAGSLAAIVLVECGRWGELHRAAPNWQKPGAKTNAKVRLSVEWDRMPFALLSFWIGPAPADWRGLVLSS
jgi:hypothetical protein